MSDEVFITSWGGNIGIRTGSRTKYRDTEWTPAQMEVPTPPQKIFDALAKKNAGIPLVPEDFPEAIAIWDEKAFSRQGDLTALGGFYAVRGTIAEILHDFDLGEGGLVPVPLFKADLETSWPEPAWWINFGASKGCFVPEESKGLELLWKGDAPDDGIWSFNGSTEDGMIAVTPKALTGSALWIERGLIGQILVHGDLGRALIEAKLKPKQRLSRARVLAGASAKYSPKEKAAS